MQEQAEAKAAHRKADNRAARGKIDCLQQQLSKQMAEAEMADHLAALRLSGVQQELKRCMLALLILWLVAAATS